MARPAPDLPFMTVDEVLAVESELPTTHEDVAGDDEMYEGVQPAGFREEESEYEDEAQ